MPPPASRGWIKNHIDHHRGARPIRLASGVGWMADRTWLANPAAAGIGSVAESAPRLVRMVLTHPSAAVADLASTHGFQRPIRQSVRARREMRALTRHTEFKGKFALRSPHSNRILGNSWSARATQYFDKWCCKLTTQKPGTVVYRGFHWSRASKENRT